jgi:hypothetical protein
MSDHHERVVGFPYHAEMPKVFNHHVSSVCIASDIERM